MWKNILAYTIVTIVIISILGVIGYAFYMGGMSAFLMFLAIFGVVIGGLAIGLGIIWAFNHVFGI